MACLITFEGIEGCGKTTQLMLLATQLKSLGHEVTVTREPGGCTIADRIRAILLDADNSAMTPMAELFLYGAARAQHVAEVITPALAAGHIVLCDRFTDATVSYQGYGRGLDLQIIAELNRLAAGDIRADLTLLVDCPVEIGLERAMTRINNSRGAREERFELESTQFHYKVREGYLTLARQEPERFIVIDGSGGIDDTASAILTAVLPRLSAG
jgi:dTMP kinase